MIQFNNSNTLSSFLKLSRIARNIPQTNISINTNIDVSLISRFESGKRIPNESQRAKLLSFYDTDNALFFREDPIISKRLSDLFTAIYEAQTFEVRERIIEAIPKDTIKKTHYYLYLYLFTFCHYVNAGKTKEASSYYETLRRTINSYEQDSQALFYMFSSLYHSRINRIDLRENDMLMTDNCRVQDERILALSHYFHIFMTPNHHDMNTIFKHYSLCRSLLEKHQNSYRLVMLNMLLANLYSNCDLVKESIQTDLETLRLLEQSAQKNVWLRTLHFNLSWSYMRIHDYQSAFDHAYACKDDYHNRTIYFMLAFCCYQLNNHHDSKKYILAARKAQPSAQFYDYLLEWLEAMLEKPYQKKCIEALLRIEKKLQYELDFESTQTIFALIVDYYHHHHELKKMNQYLNQMELKNVIVSIPEPIQ